MSEFKIEPENYVVLSELTREQHEAFYNECIKQCYGVFHNLNTNTVWKHLRLDGDNEIAYDTIPYKDITQEFITYYNNKNSAQNITNDNLVESLQQGDIITLDRMRNAFIVFNNALMNTTHTFNLKHIQPSNIASIKRGEDIIYSSTIALPTMSKDVVEALRAFNEYIMNEMSCEDNNVLDKYLKQFKIED